MRICDNDFDCSIYEENSFPSFFDSYECIEDSPTTGTPPIEAYFIHDKNELVLSLAGSIADARLPDDDIPNLIWSFSDYSDSPIGFIISKFTSADQANISAIIWRASCTLDWQPSAITYAIMQETPYIEWQSSVHTTESATK